MSEEIVGCPFCNEIPKLSAYQGTELSLECCQACVSLQVADRMTMEEREADSPDWVTCYSYPDKYYDRLKDELIDMWNERPRENLLRGPDRAGQCDDTPECLCDFCEEVRKPVREQCTKMIMHAKLLGIHAQQVRWELNGVVTLSVHDVYPEDHKYRISVDKKVDELLERYEKLWADLVADVPEEEIEKVNELLKQMGREDEI